MNLRNPITDHTTKEVEEEEMIHRDHCDSEADEALSLRDLPLSDSNTTTNDDDDYENENDRSRRRSDDLRDDLFEFSSTSSDSAMNSAEYMIFGGKLLPYAHHQSKNNNNMSDLVKRNNQTSGLITHQDLRTTGNFYHRRSESVGDFRSYSCSIEKDHHHRFIRPSRSLEYTKLHRSSSTAAKSPTKQSDRRLSSAMTCFGKSQWSVSGRGTSPAARPRWRLLMFGMMRAPVPAMELRDIRNRLSRRSPATMFSAAYDGETKTASVRRDEGGGRGSGWSLLRAFGCKGQANAVVTRAFRTCERI